MENVHLSKFLTSKTEPRFHFRNKNSSEAYSTFIHYIFNKFDF